MSVEIVVPELSESVSEATVGRWLKKRGDRVQEGEALVALETDKVDLEVGAERAGVLGEVKREEGETVSPGDVLGLLEEEETGATETKEAETSEEREEDDEDEAEERSARITPVAEKLAEKEGVDLSRVEGSGSDGRIVKADVERASEKAREEPREDEAKARQEKETKGKERREEAAPRREAAEEPSREERGERLEERQRLSTRRRAIARALSEAQREAAILTTFNDVDMSAFLSLKERFGEELERERGAGLGITSFFVKASVAALEAFPRLNAELAGNELVLKRYYDIGIAVSDPKGLVVPVVRDCERKSLTEIELEIQDLASRARSGELSVEEIQGGTFTVTNGGIFGSLMSTPILNPPQVGILGLHRIEERPVGREGRVVLRPMMFLALSYDHRVVDGAEAVQFLDRIKRLVEHPEAFVLEP